MSLGSDFQQHVDAGFSGIWVVTDEITDAQDEIVKLANKNGMLCASWTLDEGLVARDDWSKKAGTLPTIDKPDDLLKDLPTLAAGMLRAQAQAANNGSLAEDAQRFVLLLPNFHLKPFTESAKLTQAMARLPLQGRLRTGRFVIVVLSHTSKISPEYEKLFVALKHQLPDDAELTKIASKLGPTTSGTMQAAVAAARGLTRVEAENAFCLTIVQGKPFDPQLVWDLKAQMIEKSGLMTIYRGDASADRMGGLNQFFQYSESLLKGYTGENPLLMPRGILLVGVPGGGKSEAVKALANRVRRPLIMLDVGRLMGGLVGETETNTRRALSIADAMAPCILMVDEIEKALSGSSSSGGRSDGGVGMRMLGTLLTWLNDHTTDVFFMGTCNEVENLPSALTRAERFDAKFFFDFPSAKGRLAIWDIYLNLFGLPRPDPLKNDYANLLQKSVDWTGAEIRSCCRLAAIQKRPVWEVAKTIVPVSKMYVGEISKLRTWAKGNCLAADHDGIYALPPAETFQSMLAATTGDKPVVTESRLVKPLKKKNRLRLPSRSP